MSTISFLMKKMSVLLVLAMFIISIVPLAFAQDDASNNERDGSRINSFGLGDLAREKARELKEQAKEQAERIRGLGEEIKAEAKTLRELQRELASAKEKYKNVHDEYFGLKGNVSESVRLEKARNLGIAMVERMTKHVEEAIQRVKESTFDEEKKSALIERLENRLESLESYRIRIDSAETMQELREVLHDMKKEWNMARNHLLEVEKLRVEKGFGAIIKKMDNFVNRVDSQIEELKEKGMDTEDLEKQLEEINEMIAEAKVVFEELKELKSEEAAREEIKELANELKAHLKETSESLKELVSELRETVKEERKRVKETEDKEAEEEDNQTSDEESDDVDENEADADDNDSEDEEKLEVEVSGDIELTESTKALLDELTASLDVNVELKFKVKNENNIAIVEKDEVEGELSAEQQLLWNQIKEEAMLLMTAQGDGAELEIEIEYELEDNEDSNEDVDDNSEEENDNLDENENNDDEGDEDDEE